MALNVFINLEENILVVPPGELFLDMAEFTSDDNFYERGIKLFVVSAEVIEGSVKISPSNWVGAPAFNATLEKNEKILLKYKAGVVIPLGAKIRLFNPAGYGGDSAEILIRMVVEREAPINKKA